MLGAHVSLKFQVCASMMSGAKYMMGNSDTPESKLMSPMPTIPYKMNHSDSVMRSTLCRVSVGSHCMCSASHVSNEYSTASLNSCFVGTLSAGAVAFGGSSGSGVSFIQAMKFGSVCSMNGPV